MSVQGCLVPDVGGFVTADTSGDLEPREWARSVWAAVAELDPLTSCAIRLVYQQHLRQVEVARLLGVPEAVVAHSIAGGLQALCDKT